MKYDTLLLIGLESYAEGTYPYGKIASSINSKLRDSTGKMINEVLTDTEITSGFNMTIESKQG